MLKPCGLYWREVWLGTAREWKKVTSHTVTRSSRFCGQRGSTVGSHVPQMQDLIFLHTGVHWGHMRVYRAECKGGSGPI